MRRTSQYRRSLLAAALALCACENAISVPPVMPPDDVPPPVIADTTPRVVVTSTQTMTTAGETRLAAVWVDNGHGSVVPANDAIWTIDVPGVVELTPVQDGVTITAIDDGVARITARRDSFSSTFTLRVRRELSTIEIGSVDTLLTLGQSVTLAVTGLDASGHPINLGDQVTYESGNEGSIEVTSNGVVTALFTTTYINTGADVVVTAKHDNIVVRRTVNFHIEGSPLSGQLTSRNSAKDNTP